MLWTRLKRTAGRTRLNHAPKSALATAAGRARLNAARGSSGLVPEPHPQRERHQQHVGHGRGDRDPVDVAHGRSVALNAGTLMSPRAFKANYRNHSVLLALAYKEGRLPWRTPIEPQFDLDARDVALEWRRSRASLLSGPIPDSEYLNVRVAARQLQLSSRPSP